MVWLEDRYPSKIFKQVIKDGIKPKKKTDYTRTRPKIANRKNRIIFLIFLSSSNHDTEAF